MGHDAGRRNRLGHWLSNLRLDTAGSTLVTFGIALPVIVGIAGFGLESGIWYLEKRKLQTQADAAALAGAFERAKGQPGDVDVVAGREAARNGFLYTAPNTIAVNNPPITGPRIGNGGAVEVILRRPHAPLFTSIFISDINVRTRAVAAVEVTGAACVLALDPGMSGAITNQGNVTINLEGCSVAANSSHSRAIDIMGNGHLIAESLWTTGNYNLGGDAILDLQKKPVVNAWKLDDPYEGIAIPSIGSCNVSSAHYTGGSFTLSPGVYCDGMKFGSTSDIVLNPGTYYIDRGDLEINASARVRCDCTAPGEGVTFVLTSTGASSEIGTVTINGGADVLLNAPSAPSDPFSGVLIYQDSVASTDGVNRLNGGPLMSLTGAVYFRNQAVRWSVTCSP